MTALIDLKVRAQATENEHRRLREALAYLLGIQHGSRVGLVRMDDLSRLKEEVSRNVQEAKRLRNNLRSTDQLEEAENICNSLESTLTFIASFERALQNGTSRKHVG